MRDGAQEDTVGDGEGDVAFGDTLVRMNSGRIFGTSVGRFFLLFLSGLRSTTSSLVDSVNQVFQLLTWTLPILELYFGEGEGCEDIDSAARELFECDSSGNSIAVVAIECVEVRRGDE